LGFLFSSLNRLDPLHLADSEVLQEIVPKQDSCQVAAKDVKKQTVPPALVEIGKPVSEGKFKQFKADGTNPHDVPVSHD
jgi:hypothetical protein